MELHFLGGAGTVTGSKTILDTGQTKILVDCGLFQGVKEQRLKNRMPFPIDPRSIGRVLITHPHLDHCGYLPMLVKQGYRGKIYCTEPARAIIRILLLDYARLAEEDARLANRMGFSKHKPALPLYTQADVTATLRRIEILSIGDWHAFGQGLRLRFQENGHILGSVFAEFEADHKRVVFSGDLGRERPLLIRPPKAPRKADYLVLESTYGDRNHDSRNPEYALEDILRRTYERKGKVLIPSFAVGRTQDLLYLLLRLRRRGALPDMPVYLDSPMAIEVSEVLARHSDWQKLPPKDLRDMFRDVRLLRTARESERVRSRSRSALIIAGSGMATGGRILNHFEDCLPEPRHSVVLVGFQAHGTRGALLASGAPDVKIHGTYVPVRAEIHQIGGLSAHADRRELLLWVQRIRSAPRIFLNHGEPQAADALRVLLEGRQVEIVKEGTRVSL